MTPMWGIESKRKMSQQHIIQNSQYKHRLFGISGSFSITLRRGFSEDLKILITMKDKMTILNCISWFLSTSNVQTSWYTRIFNRWSELTSISVNNTYQSNSTCFICESITTQHAIFWETRIRKTITKASKLRAIFSFITPWALHSSGT